MYVILSIYDYIRMLQKFYHEYSSFYTSLIYIAFIILVLLALGVVLIGTKRDVVSLVLYTILGIISMGIVAAIFYPPFLKFLIDLYNSLCSFFSNLYRYLSTYLHSLSFSRQLLIVYIYHIWLNT